MPSQAASDHGYARQEASPLDEFKLHAFNFAIQDVIYDQTVVNQIKQQQAAIMQVQTAIAQSKQAEQAAITAEKNGQAEAAKAKWDQEVIKGEGSHDRPSSAAPWLSLLHQYPRRSGASL